MPEPILLARDDDPYAHARADWDAQVEAFLGEVRLMSASLGDRLGRDLTWTELRGVFAHCVAQRAKTRFS